ncbi:MAG: tetratricopeptide repeat protein [Planctomycetes bacterium]|nr:tetratricopeptide repeat protein [Planctomycetota bacterium]
MGVAYLEQAMDYVGEGQDGLKARYLTQIASALRAEAQELARRDDSADSKNKIKTLSVRAAEASLALSRLDKLDLFRSADAMEAAAGDLNLAGETDRMIEVLQSYVERFSVEQVESGRARAYLKLARAYQAKAKFRDAIDAYEHVILEFPRQPEALDSMVPRAACYLRLGGEDAARGEALLIEIVDDRGAEPVFTPSAQEYRDALVLLGEHYVLPIIDEVGDKDHAAEEARLVKGVTRLENTLALYPSDESVPRLRFFLAEAYRRSSEAIVAGAATVDAGARREVERRLRRAYENYSFVKDKFARMDAGELTALQKTYLRASYLYLGDCLFDLNETERAVEAYREAAWRYENEPAAVAAMMQVVNCYYRMGRAVDAKAALARMNWLLKKIPDDAFAAVSAMSPKSYWQDMVTRLERAELN